MSPKSTTNATITINAWELGIAAKQPFSKEILIDYLAHRIAEFGTGIIEWINDNGSGNPRAYQEFVFLARTLTKHRNAGLEAQIDLGCEYKDLRGFVTWSKREVADYWVYQLIALGVTDIIGEAFTGTSELQNELCAIAYPLLHEIDSELGEKADGDAERRRDYLLRGKQSVPGGKPSDAAPAAVSPSGLSPAECA